MENMEHQLADYKTFMERHPRLSKPLAFTRAQSLVTTTVAATSDTTAQTAAGRKRSMSTGSQLEATTPSYQNRKHQRPRRSNSFDNTIKAMTLSNSLSSLPSVSAAHQKMSPLGDFGEMGTRRLMTDLILTLNASFPDYDFGNGKPSDFEKIPVATAMRRINERLSELAVEKASLLSDMWNAMDEVARIADCDVYTYAPKARDEDDDPLSFLTQTLMDSVNTEEHSYMQENGSLSDGSNNTGSAAVLWSFNYFFVNKSLKRIVFFPCIECMRSEGANPNDDDVDYVRYHGAEASDLSFDLDPSADVAGGFPISTV